MLNIPTKDRLYCHCKPTDINANDLALIRKNKKEEIVVFTKFISKKRKIMQELYELQVDRKNIRLVIDMSDMDEERFEIIKYNLKTFVHPSNFNGYNVSFYFKLNESINFEKHYLQYLDDLMSEYKIREIIVGMPEPAEKTSNFFIYKNYKYFELIKKFILWHKLAKKPIKLDGAIYPCMVPNSIELFTLMEDLGCGIYGLKNDNNLEPPEDCKKCQYFKGFCKGPHANFYS